MANHVDLTGQRFGLLTVVKKEKDYIQSNGRRRIQYLCRCDCGNEIIVKGDSLKGGHTKSCGCLKLETCIKNLGKYAESKYNTYDLSGEYGIGYTSNTNEPFYFDLEDYDKIKDYYWYKNYKGYLQAHSKNTHNNEMIMIHRIILNNIKDNDKVDHIHHNLLDNRKSELRIVTNSQNMMNRVTNKNNKSGHKGVCYLNNHWVAYIQKDKNNIRKNFDNKEEAIKWREKMEYSLFGDYAYKEG